MSIRRTAVADCKGPEAHKLEAWTVARPMPGVMPAGAGMAMDSAIQSSYDWAQSSALYSEGLGFLGYPYLAELTQRAEYRRPAEIMAREMTRKWIKLTATGGDDKTDRIAELDAETKRLDLQGVFRRALEMDGFFGRAHLFLDFGNVDPDEVKTPLALSSAKIAIGSLKRVAVVEPMWTYPNNYNSVDPLAPDFYRPGDWFVMGKSVHKSRLLTIISRDVPDMLKPAYSFGGLSLSQMLKPYVDNWLRTRQSVSDGISNFSIMMLLTDLSSVLNGGGAQTILDRAAMFNAIRDNNAVMIADKNNEDLKNVSMPLSGLDHLQAQSQEHMAAVCGIPLVKLFGITPSGLNASSEGEIECFNTEVEAAQEAVCTKPLDYILKIIQLSLWGEVDPDIRFIWEPLGNMDAGQIAAARKTDIDGDCALIEAGVITPEEARQRLAGEEDSPYKGLDLSAELPDMTGGDDGEGSSPFEGASDAQSRGQPGNAGQFGPGGGAKKGNLTQSEKTYVEMYTGDDFLKVNSSLRSGGEPDKMVKAIDSAIDKSPPIAEKKTLYRGMSRDAAKQLFPNGEINVGDTISDRAFASTSKSTFSAQAAAIGGVMLVIEAMPGSKGMDVGSVTRNPSEDEVLLPRNAKMKVLGVRAPKKHGEPVRVRVSYGHEE